ncbi:hypothetical protein HNR39_002409 [Glaciimonas immobilis]|uniref:Uncharacterized protein n=1 Tax=Glaciimonas immobilis TaxID=728004 RepID=A0A840RQ91_9BURK|nr:hypothetical protein [Glaciimonas immobilis]
MTEITGTAAYTTVEPPKTQQGTPFSRYPFFIY